jgi:hypothetical protein
MAGLTRRHSSGPANYGIINNNNSIHFEIDETEQPLLWV